MRNFIKKNLEIEKTKPTFIRSVLKVEYYGVLVSLISNFFTNKISHANKWLKKNTYLQEFSFMTKSRGLNSFLFDLSTHKSTLA